MSVQAKVTSVDALDAFRASMVIFVTKARGAVDTVRDRVRRTRNWLQHDQRVHWAVSYTHLTLPTNREV